MNRKWAAWSVCTTLLWCVATPPAGAQDTNTNAGDRSRWFREARFGVFIHWGVASVLGEGEHVMQRRKMTVAEYDKLVTRFHPEKFDAKQVVSLAKRAGAQYVTVTAKQRDGFCMFDSKETDFDVMSTPLGRDVIAELTRECRQQDLPVCYYYSMVDWHHPEYSPRPGWLEDDGSRDISKYLQYVRLQLRELCTNYGKIDALWVASDDRADKELAVEFTQIDAMIRKLQPGILINDHGDGRGDFQCFERLIPPARISDQAGKPPLWQTSITMTAGHGSFPPAAWMSYDKHEKEFEPADYLIRSLADAASRGGNLALTVGPNSDGTVQPEFVERLEAVGQWMFRNKAAIVATTASPFRYLPFFGRVTVRGDQLFAIVFDWPGEGELRLPGLTSLPKSARPLVGGSALSVTSSGQDVLITGLTKTAPDPVASVVVVDLAGQPSVEPVSLKPDGAGYLELPAMHGSIFGKGGQRARLKASGGDVFVANWTNPSNYLQWEFETTTNTVHSVSIEYSCDEDRAGSTLELAVGDRKLTGAVRPTGNATTFAWVKLGEIELPAGKHLLTLKASRMPKQFVANLRTVRLQGRIN